jgi:hypothetical protein
MDVKCAVKSTVVGKLSAEVSWVRMIFAACGSQHSVVSVAAMAPSQWMPVSFMRGKPLRARYAVFMTMKPSNVTATEKL